MSDPILAWGTTLQLTIAGGFAGGCAAALNTIIVDAGSLIDASFRKDDENSNSRSGKKKFEFRPFDSFLLPYFNVSGSIGYLLLIFISGLVGAAVGCGVLFIWVLTPIGSAIQNHDYRALFFVASGILSGVFAQRIVPLLERSFRDALSKQADEASRDAKRAQEQAAEASQAAILALNQARDAVMRVEEAEQRALGAAAAARAAAVDMNRAKIEADAAIVENNLLSAFFGLRMSPPPVPTTIERVIKKTQEFIDNNPEYKYNRNIIIKLANTIFIGQNNRESALSTLSDA